VAVAEEDLVSPQRYDGQLAEGSLRIEVVHLPRIANVTDVDALAREPEARVRFIDRPGHGEPPDCVILPGSKSTIADLAWLRERGFEPYLQRCLAAGGEVVGVCGGFQMLGRYILDPDHVEAAVSAAAGLGWLPVTTHFAKEKLVAQVRGEHLESGRSVAGYEIHMGRMQYAPSTAHVIRLTERGGHAIDEADGAQSQEGRVWGTHLHGVFDQPEFRRWWLQRLRVRRGLPLEAATASMSPTAAGPGTADLYDCLAASVRPHLNLEAIFRLMEMHHMKVEV
jgi:adenosylcobyric acid synthase